MLTAYAVADVRAAEDRARAGLAPDALMRRAAEGLAEVVAERAAERGADHVVVLAGPGDNGGDALHAAALLARSLGVVVVAAADRLHAGGGRAVEDAGLRVHRVPPDAAELPEQVRAVLADAHLVVDGLLGIGGRPGLRGAMRRLVEEVPDTAYLVAVDLPSGTDPDGLAPIEHAVFADETVTFGMLKPVHLLPATEPAVGRLTVVDIGVDVGDLTPAVERLEPADVMGLWPVPGPTDDKYRRGVLGVIAGSAEYPGAAVLCTTAALGAGVGMIRYVGPERPQELVLAACPEVVPGQGQIQAMVIGPGVPVNGAETADRRQAQWFRQALASQVPSVVDAGALELLASWHGSGHRRCEAPTLLTPHAGELARLLTGLEGREVTREQVESDRVRYARRAAATTGAVVLLKGSTTLVVDPDPAVPVRAQAEAPAWLATAGSGDVLAGLCGALLASGLAPRDVGAVAALVHGLAAHRANPGGPVRALSVAQALPQVVSELLGL